MDESDGTDAELLERLASGDQRAMAVVFDRHAPAVTRYAWAIAPSRMDVEEIVQDTFLTVWRKAAEIMIAEASLLPWLLSHVPQLRNERREEGGRARRAEQFDDDARGSAAPTLVREHHDAEAARDDLRWVLDEIERLGADRPAGVRALPGRRPALRRGGRAARPQRRRSQATCVPEPGPIEEGGDPR